MCLIAVFEFDLLFFLAQISTKPFGRMPSTMIFESNHGRFYRERAHTVRLCISRLGREIISKDFVHVCLVAVSGFGLPSFFAYISTHRFDRMTAVCFYHHHLRTESRMLLTWKGKTVRLCISRFGRYDNFKGFRTFVFGYRVWVRPAFLLVVHLDT